MTKDEAIDKVKKLLALSHSPNEHEAALAAVMAKKILSTYNISGLDINEETGKTDFVREYVVEVGRVDEWTNELYKAVQQPYNCEVFLDFGPIGLGPTKLVFMGEAANAKIAAYVTEYLLREIDRMADEAYETTQTPTQQWVDVSFAWGNPDALNQLLRPTSRSRFMKSYRIGATMRIVEEILKQIEKVAAEQALVPYMKNAIDDHVRNKYGEIGNLEVEKEDESGIDMYAAGMGYEDGRGISPKPAIEGGQD